VVCCQGAGRRWAGTQRKGFLQFSRFVALAQSQSAVLWLLLQGAVHFIDPKRPACEDAPALALCASSPRHLVTVPPF